MNKLTNMGIKVSSNATIEADSFDRDYLDMIFDAVEKQYTIKNFNIIPFGNKLKLTINLLPKDI